MSTPSRVTSTSRTEWLPIAELRVSPVAQRDLRSAWVDQLAAEFDPVRIGKLLVNKRDGRYYIVDGQHRVAAMRQMGWDDQSIECEITDGLTEAEEADLFLWRNKRLNVRPFDMFRVAVVAEREQETTIDKIVRRSGFTISDHGKVGTIGAVGALRKVYAHGPDVLGRALNIIAGAFDGQPINGQVIEGVGLVCARYNGDLNDDHAKAKLSGLRTGVNGLIQRAALNRNKTGRPVSHCTAAAVVDVINAGKGGKKLSSWWS